MNNILALISANTTKKLLSMLKARRLSKLTQDDVDLINSNILKVTESRGLKDLHERLDAVTLAEIKSPRSREKALEILNNYGILVVPEFLRAEEAQELASKIMSAYESELNQLETNWVETPNALVQSGPAILSGHESLSSYKKPVIHIRQEQDAGMIDIFNVDKLIDSHGDSLRAHFQERELEGLLAKKYSELQSSTINCYINDGVDRTRGFHVDSYTSRMKAFIYLTDVNQLSDGPYTYVKGSHLDSPYRKLNKVLSKYLPNGTEAPVIDVNDILPVLAPKGALVISDQTGIHRGWPQRGNGFRIIAVMNYTTKKNR